MSAAVELFAMTCCSSGADLLFSAADTELQFNRLIASLLCVEPKQIDTQTKLRPPGGGAISDTGT